MAEHAKERRRLEDAMRRYLEALAAHELGRIRFAPDLRNTENAIALPVGAGLSRTIRGLRPGGHDFVDVEASQVEHWGVADEMGGPVILGVRLKIRGDIVVEVETLAVRGTGEFFQPEAVLAADGGLHDIVPPAERATRAELIGAAHGYFDAIERSDGELVAIADDCLRLVNGVEDTVTDVSALPESEAHRALSAKAQMSRGDYAYIEGLRARRFPIVDEERGLVMAHVMFDHPGDRKRAVGDIPFRSPNSMLCFEVFKVRAGLIRAVWAIGTALPYGVLSGWD